MHGIPVDAAAEVLSNQDMANEEIEKLKEARDTWVKLGMGKDYERWERFNDSKLVRLKVGSQKGKTKYRWARKASDGAVIWEDEYKELNGKYLNIGSAFSPYYDQKIRDTQNQYENEKWQIINGAKQALADENNQNDEWQKWIDEMNDRIKDLKAGDGAAAPKEKTDVGTVDKIKDTVDVTDEDLKFMRDFAEREIINKIQTTALSPQINVEFSGEIKETVDVNEMIGRVTNELANAINNSAQGVHV